MAGIALAAYMNKEKLKLAYEVLVASGEQEIQKLSTKPEEIIKYITSTNDESVQYGLKILLYKLVRKGKDLSEYFKFISKALVFNNVTRLFLAAIICECYSAKDEIFMLANTFQKEVTVQSYFERANSFKLFAYLPSLDFKYIALTAVKMNNSTPNPYIRFMLAICLLKTIQLGKIVENEYTVIKEKVEEHYQLMLNDIHPYSLYSKVSIINMVLYLSVQFGESYLKYLHRIIAYLIENIRKCDKLAISGVCHALINYTIYYLSDTVEADKKFKDSLIANASQYLLKSNDPTIIMSLTSLLYHVGAKFEKAPIARCILRLINLDNYISFQALKVADLIAIKYPETYAKNYIMFYPSIENSEEIRHLKFNILAHIISEANYNQILTEVSYWINSSILSAVSQAIATLGNIVRNQKDCKSEALRKLITLLKHTNNHIMSAAVGQLKHILSTDCTTYRAIVVFCAKIIKKLTSDEARSSVIWLVSKYSSSFPTISKELIRKFTLSYQTEGIYTKHSLLQLGFQVWLSDTISGVKDEKYAKIFNLLLQQTADDAEITLNQKGNLYRLVQCSTANQESFNKMYTLLKQCDKVKEEHKSNNLLHSCSFLVRS